MAAQVQLERDGGSRLRERLRPRVAGALAAPTGPDLVSELMSLTGRDDLSAREWLEAAAGWRRVIAFAHAGQLAAVAGLDQAMRPDAATSGDGATSAGSGPTATSRPGRADPARRAADELAPSLGIAPKAASMLVALSRRAEEHLPAAVDALADGRMDLAQLRALDRVARDLPQQVTAQVEAVAVRTAARRTAGQLEADLAAEAARLDPEYAATATARGVAERDVTLRRSPLPGCRRLVADLPHVQAVAAWLALNGAAKNTKKTGRRRDGTPETRTLPQVRADFLNALITGQTDPTGGRVPTPTELAHLAEVQVVVAYDTLTGVSDLPGHLPGIGPVDPDTVRDLTTRTRLRRLVADPETGTLLHRDHHTHHPEPTLTRQQDTGPHDAGPHDAGQPATGQQDADVRADPRLARMLTDPLDPGHTDDGTRYRPSPRLRDHVLTRDATCIGPACFHPGSGTQLDHTINHGQRDHRGALGTTTDDNLAGLCERVHNAKTHGGWRLRQPTPGTFEWTTPTGRTYRVSLRPLVPGWHTLRRRPPPPTG